MAKIGNSIQSSLSKNEKKQGNQLLSWFFTWNNYPSDAIANLEITFHEICVRYVFQEEVGEQGTPHLQGVINLHKKMRWSEFKLSSDIRWFKTNNEQAARDYCQKEESRAGKTIKWGDWPQQIKIITDLYPWQKELEDIALGEPDGRTVHWRHEATGNMGKSAFCKYMVVKHHATVVRGGKLSDLMNIIFNTDMDKCRCVIFDIPRGHKGHVSYTSLESILDGLITNTKYETGCKVFNPPNVICLANFPPDKLEELSADRWDVREL